MRNLLELKVKHPRTVGDSNQLIFHRKYPMQIIPSVVLSDDAFALCSLKLIDISSVINITGFCFYHYVDLVEVMFSGSLK
jgi:hypothetical protein